MLEIGNLKLKSKFILAPMAGISDLPYRLLNRAFGAELAFIEMINCRSLSFNSRKTKQMLEVHADDRPLGVQLLGVEPKFILKALEVIHTYNFDLLDFNAACPAKKVIRRGEGAGLLKDVKKLQELLKLVVKNSRIPVTVKLRTGWDEQSVNALDTAYAAMDAGVSAVFIHGRTRMQGYSGSVDYESIRQVKKALKIPVIASGDLLSPGLIKEMFARTGCDAVAIARGTLGNPWIFQEAEEFLRNGNLTIKPDIQEVVEVMGRHLDDCVDFYGERVGVVKFRKFFSWYTKGFRKIRPLRQEASTANTKKAMLGIIALCKGQYKSRPGTSGQDKQKTPDVFGVFCR